MFEEKIIKISEKTTTSLSLTKILLKCFEEDFSANKADAWALALVIKEQLESANSFLSEIETSL